MIRSNQLNRILTKALVYKGMDDRETTPEFEERCTHIITSWQAGKLAFKDALAKMRRMADEAARAGHRANEARARDRLGLLQHYRGNLQTSSDHYTHARELYTQVDNHVRIANIDLNQGENHRFMGDAAAALQLYRSAYALAEAHGLVRVQTMAALNEGLLLADAGGQYASAGRSLRRALDLLLTWTTHDDLFDGIMMEIHHGLVVIALYEGDIEAARLETLKAWGIAQGNPLPLHTGFANRLVGMFTLAAGNPPDAVFGDDPNAYLEAAIKAFRGINAEGEVARTMLLQARHLAQQGEHERASFKLRNIIKTCTRLGMVNYAAMAAEAERELF